MTEVNIGYKKNDFLWTVGKEDSDSKLSDEEEKNKEKSEDLIKIRTKHSGSDERYNNISKQHSRVYMDAVNLILGMLVALVIILFNYDPSLVYVLLMAICAVLILYNYDSVNAPVVLLVIILGILYRFYILSFQ